MRFVWLVCLVFCLPGHTRGDEPKEPTPAEHRQRASAINKQLHDWGIRAEMHLGCGDNHNPYLGNDRILAVMEIIAEYQGAKDLRHANLWRRHLAHVYELGLRDCGTLTLEEGMSGYGGQSLVLARDLYETIGDQKEVRRIDDLMRQPKLLIEIKKDDPDRIR